YCARGACADLRPPGARACRQQEGTDAAPRRRLLYPPAGTRSSRHLRNDLEGAGERENFTRVDRAKTRGNATAWRRRSRKPRGARAGDPDYLRDYGRRGSARLADDPQDQGHRRPTTGYSDREALVSRFRSSPHLAAGSTRTSEAIRTLAN